MKGVIGVIRHWWTGLPDVIPCPLCGCPIQATTTGTLDDGMLKHTEMVHRDLR